MGGRTPLGIALMSADMITKSIIDYNQQKAASQGKSIEQLIDEKDIDYIEPFSYGFDKTLQDPKQFFRYGVFIKKKFFDEDQISTLKNKVCKIVEGKYETGMQPDKIKYSKFMRFPIFEGISPVSSFPPKPK